MYVVHNRDDYKGSNLLILACQDTCVGSVSLPVDYVPRFSLVSEI